VSMGKLRNVFSSLTETKLPGLDPLRDHRASADGVDAYLLSKRVDPRKENEAINARGGRGSVIIFISTSLPLPLLPSQPRPFHLHSFDAYFVLHQRRHYQLVSSSSAKFRFVILRWNFGIPSPPFPPTSDVCC